MKTQEIKDYYFLHELNVLNKKYNVYVTNKDELNIKNIETKYKMTINNKEFVASFIKWYSEINKDLIIKWKKEYKKRKKDYEKEYKRKYPFKYKEDISATSIEDYMIHLIKENNL